MAKKAPPFYFQTLLIENQKFHVILAKNTKDAITILSNNVISKKIILIPYSRFLWFKHKLRFEQNSSTRCYFYAKQKDGGLCFFDRRKITLPSKKTLNTHPLNIDTNQGYILQGDYGLKGDFLFRMNFDRRFKEAFEIKMQNKSSLIKTFILKIKKIKLRVVIHFIYKKALTKLDSISS